MLDYRYKRTWLKFIKSLSNKDFTDVRERG